MRCFQSPMAVDNNPLYRSLLLSLFHQTNPPPKHLPSTNMQNKRSRELGPKGSPFTCPRHACFACLPLIFLLTIALPFFPDTCHVRTSSIEPALKYGAWKEKKGNPTKVEQIFRTRA